MCKRDITWGAAALHEGLSPLCDDVEGWAGGMGGVSGGRGYMHAYS